MQNKKKIFEINIVTFNETYMCTKLQKLTYNAIKKFYIAFFILFLKKNQDNILSFKKRPQ